MKRFVIHQHYASRLHYDFRLEMQGVLKSWAIPKGPPVEPGVKRLAIEVEDHPLDYIDFEGTIAEGSYGAGLVRIWDSGTYELIDVEEDLFRFQLNGVKLKGVFKLVKMDWAGGNQWLMMRSKKEVKPKS